MGILLVLMVFLIVLCVACTSKRHSNLEYRQQPEDFLEDASSESSEIKMTLEPSDYDIWMPIICYQKLIESKSKMYHKECTICYDDLSNNVIRKIIVCGHIFHDECLIKWLKERETCPNCKHSLTKSAMEERREELMEMSRIEKKKHGTRNKNNKQNENSPFSPPPSNFLKNLEKQESKNDGNKNKQISQFTPHQVPQIEINGLELDKLSSISKRGQSISPNCDCVPNHEVEPFDEFGFSKYKVKKDHQNGDLAEEYVSSRKNLSIPSMIRTLKVNRTPEVSLSQSAKKTHNLKASQENHNFKQSRNKIIKLSIDSAQINRLKRQKTLSTGEEDEQYKIIHQEVIVKEQSKNNCVNKRRETLPGKFMQRKIVDDTFKKALQRHHTLGKRKETILSKDILSKPSEFSLYRQGTLKSKQSENSHQLNDDSNIKIPRFITNPMQESGSLSSIEKINSKNSTKVGKTTTTKNPKSKSVPKIKTNSKFQFGGEGFTQKTNRNLYHLKTIGPAEIREVAEDNKSIESFPSN